MKIFRTFVAMLFFVLLFTFLPISQKEAYANTSGEFTYEVTDGQATITGYTGGNTIVTIPATVDGFTVVAIGNNAFKDNKVITSVTIPNTVTSIGGFAFYYCSSITNVQIPDSVTTIGDSAFAYNTSLANITLPVNLTTIDDCVFQDCTALTSITIPDNVTSIGIYSFFECIKLTDIVIPSKVTSIGEGAFKGCKALKSATLDENVQTIGKFVFYECSLLSSVTLPSQLTSIPDYMFYRCYALTGITIPSTVTSIGWSSFEQCTTLENIVLPNKVISIGTRAFVQCAALKNVVLPNSLQTISDNAFAHCDSFTNIVIPSSVTKIGNYSFYYCTKLTEVTVPPSVTDIGFLAFDACNSAFTLKGITGSYVQDYACGNSLAFIDPNPVESITFDQTTKSLKAGEGFSIVASISPSTASNQAINWSSSDTNVAVVSGAGYVTAVGNGTATITAKSVAGNKTATCTITVISAADQFKASTPSNLTAIATNYKTISLKWSAVPGADIYKLYVATSSAGKYTLLANVTTCSYVNTGLDTGKTYYYKVAAYQKTTALKSKYSSIVKATPILPKPNVLSALKASKTSIKLTFKPVSGANGYVIYRAISLNGTYSKITTTNSTKYTNTSLVKKRTYYYKIRAYRLVNNVKVYSGYSTVTKIGL